MRLKFLRNHHRIGTSVSRLKSEILSLKEERYHQNLVIEINHLLLNHLEPGALFQAISTALWDHVHHEFMALTSIEEDDDRERIQFLDTPPFRGRYRVGEDLPQFLGLRSSLTAPRKIEVIDPDGIDAIKPVETAKILKGLGIRSICYLPMVSRGRTLGVLSIGCKESNAFSPVIIRLLECVADQIAIAIDNALAFQDIRIVKNRTEEEKLYLEEEIVNDFATSEIIGKSPALLQVLRQIKTVAQSDATVLLLGETGTGKELVARAIHENSRRNSRTFVKLNCSVIPFGLIESELFGHERGAFTGAIAKKIGRFELAHQGSLFLDEVGDLPLEIQPKLLRAIQEKEFERLGSNTSQRVDVRLIAATHRNLQEMTANGTFRNDLFYRLNVFPIQIPSLRERKEDIPNLVKYFVQKFAKSMDKKIERIPSHSMSALVAWTWPGNIRELQNLIERSVILTQTNELHVPLSELHLSNDPGGAAPNRTFEDLEREGILAALKTCNGVVGGPEGAAALLGLKRTTLHSKMRKLGIERGW